VQGLRGVLRLIDRPEPAGHFGFVDALRGIAVLAVMLVHTGQRVPGLPASVTAFTDAGAYGVHLFFVASAFTLFWSLHRRSRSERRPTLNYFLRRLFRIAPLFWLAIAFYLWWNGTGPQYWAPHGLGWRDALVTACFIHGWGPTTINSVVPGGWSIAVEANFYLLVPALFKRLAGLRQCLWFFVACVAGQAILNAAMRPVFPRLLAADEQYLADLMHTLWLPSQLPVFAAGFVLYYAVVPYLTRSDDLERQFQDPPSTGLLALAAAALVALRFTGPLSTFWGSTFAIGAAALALRPTPVLVNAATRYLGDISYSGYLVHFAVLDLAARAVRHAGAIPRQPLPHLVVLYAAVVFGTVVTATLTHRLIEDPARALGRRLIGRLESDPHPLSQPA
jgi:peptidoglycan/LPS O-acetylase OafA/YrhL